MEPGNRGIEIDVVGRTDVGRRRRNNEDSLLVADLSQDCLVPAGNVAARVAVGEKGVLLAVSDGMGGSEAGEVASAMTLDSVRRGMIEASGRSGEIALRAAVERANRTVWEAAGGESRPASMGATLTACLIVGAHAYLAEVGDSRAYVLRAGQLVQVTRDQSYVQLLVDAGGLSEEAARHSPLRNMILQAIGKAPQVVVALTRLALRRGDRLLLCSDGLSGEVPADRMQRIAADSSLDGACAGLIEAANKQGGRDNITVVMARVDGDDVPEPSAAETVRDTLETIRPYAPAGL